MVRAGGIVAAESLVVICQASSATDLPATGHAPDVQIHVLSDKDVGDRERPHFEIRYERFYNLKREIMC